MKYLSLFLISSFFISCSIDKPQDKSADQVKTANEIKNSDLVRNPIDPEKIDTVNVAKIEFAEAEYNFGTVTEGTMVKHSFKFKNTGKVPLIITECQASCGCTVPTCPKKPIPPGESGEIHIKFDSENRVGSAHKLVSVSANTYPRLNKVMIVGEVTEKKK